MKNKLLMVAGPTEIEEDIRQEGAQPMSYFRTPEFSQFVLEIERKLKHIFRTNNDIFILSSSTTGVMEAAVVNCLSPGDEIVILVAGQWGYRWFEIASRYRINCHLVNVPFGDSVDPVLLYKNITDRTKAVFVTATETSSGVTIDLEAIGNRIKSTAAILVVDAAASIGSDPLETDKWFCDIVLCGSQKGLAIPPGLSFITLSGKAWIRVQESRIPKFYFDLNTYKENLVRGQTPFTPPISLLYQLDVRLNEILKEGLDKVINRHHERSVYLRKGLSNLGVNVIGTRSSNGVTGIRFPDGVDAFDIVQRLRNEYSIEISPSPDPNKHTIARIGLWGNITFSDIDNLLYAMRKILAK